MSALIDSLLYTLIREEPSFCRHSTVIICASVSSANGILKDLQFKKIACLVVEIEALQNRQ